MKALETIKKVKRCPQFFVRDAPCNHTHNRQYVELQHIHFHGSDFSLKMMQFSRTRKVMLVYCPGFFNAKHYLLVAIINHWNHNQPEVIEDTDPDKNIMDKLEEIAEGFRQKF